MNFWCLLFTPVLWSWYLKCRMHVPFSFRLGYFYQFAWSYQCRWFVCVWFVANKPSALRISCNRSSWSLCMNNMNYNRLFGWINRFFALINAWNKMSRLPKQLCITRKHSIANLEIFYENIWHMWQKYNICNKRCCHQTVVTHATKCPGFTNSCARQGWMDGASSTANLLISYQNVGA